jgi:hypothetical protein
VDVGEGNLHKAVSEFVMNQLDNDFEGLVHETLHESSNTKRHGRLESRTYIQFEIPEDFPLEEKWVGLKSFGVVVRETSSADKHTVERRVPDASPYQIRHFVCAGPARSP